MPHRERLANNNELYGSGLHFGQCSRKTGRQMDSHRRMQKKPRWNPICGTNMATKIYTAKN